MKTYKFIGGPKDGRIYSVHERENQVVFQEMPYARLVHDAGNPDVNEFSEIERHVYVKDRIHLGPERFIEYFRYSEISGPDIFERFFGVNI